MTTLILLVSDQTIPNYLSVKTFPEADHYVFITTSLMENHNRGNRREWIMKAAGILPEQADFVVVNPEVKSDVMTTLSEVDWNRFGELIVNITGGTKMMSLAAYEFFKHLTQWIWYIPVGSNHYHLCDNAAMQREVTWQMSVDEYLSCCGIHKDENRFMESELLLPDYHFFEVWNSGQVSHDHIEKIRLIFRDSALFSPKLLPDWIPEEPEYAGMTRPEIIALWKSLRKAMERDGFAPLTPGSPLDFVNNLVASAGFPLQQAGQISKAEVGYLTGGWFEEHCCRLLRQVTGGRSDQFKVGVTLIPSPAQAEKAQYITHNELDVLFVHNNNLYVVECKTGGMEGGDLFNKTVYLASALRKYFLLTVRSALFTLSELKPAKKEKAEVMGITVVDKSVITSPDALSLIAKEMKIKRN